MLFWEIIHDMKVPVNLKSFLAKRNHRLLKFTPLSKEVYKGIPTISLVKGDHHLLKSPLVKVEFSSSKIPLGEGGDRGIEI